MLSGSFLCPNVPQVSHCPSLVQVSLLTKVFVIDLRVSATAGPPVNECPLWGECPPVGGSHIECPGWCLLILSTVTSRLFFDIQEAPQQSPNIGEHICFSHWPVHRRIECPPVSTGGSPRVSTMGSVTYRCPVGVRCCSPLCRRHLNQAEYSHIWCPSL